MGDFSFKLSRLKAKQNMTKTAVIDLQYADDCAILAHKTEELQTSVDLLTEAYQSLGLSINIRKTKIIYVNPFQATLKDLLILKYLE